MQGELCTVNRRGNDSGRVDRVELHSAKSCSLYSLSGHIEPCLKLPQPHFPSPTIHFHPLVPNQTTPLFRQKLRAVKARHLARCPPPPPQVCNLQRPCHPHHLPPRPCPRPPPPRPQTPRRLQIYMHAWPASLWGSLN